MIAPGMLPSPPITVTIRPFTVSGSDEQRRQHADRRAEHGAGNAADHAGDHEGEQVHLRDADAAQLRRDRLLRDRARREAKPRAVEQNSSTAMQRQPSTKHEDAGRRGC